MTIDLGLAVTVLGALIAITGLLLKMGRDKEAFGERIGNLQTRLQHLEKHFDNYAEVLTVLQDLRETTVHLKARLEGLEKHWQEILAMIERHHKRES